MKKSLIFTLLSILCFISPSLASLPSAPVQISMNKYDHFIATVLTDPPSIMLDDGTIWSFGTKSHLNKKMKTLFDQWKEGHSIQFSHETGIFNSWYHMNNLETGDKIDTELLAEACDELALHIVEFDLYTKTITLNDGSKWIVSKKNCSHCLSRIKQRFTNKIFVTKAYKSDTFYLITSTSSLEHLEVVPAN